MRVDPAPHFSWAREFAIPALFTFLGAVIGFLSSQLRDSWEARRNKKTFARAIGMELDALGTQLDDTLNEVRDSAARVDARGTGPQFAYSFRTAVFTSQLGKLRDVDDPLMIRIVHFYSDLGTLQHILESTNDLSAECSRTPELRGERDAVRSRLSSSLTVLQREITGFAKRLKALRSKLPPA
jgi:hypothetical protein